MKKLFIGFIIINIFITIMLNGIVFADELSENDPISDVFLEKGCETKTIQPLKIDAGLGVVIDAKSGRVLYDKNAYTKSPMASTTKIMTAILAIENGDLKDKVLISKKAACIWGSKINLKEGELLTLEELLYGLMLNSGNDAAIAVAEHIGGTLENFIDMMNKKASSLNLKNTYFKTPHGLDVEGHFTTPYELALLTKYALNNAVFSKIVSTVQTTIGNRHLYNTNEMLQLYPGVNGVKTGYTGQAGRCLVVSANRSDFNIISVVFKCPSRQTRANSTKKMLDYSFNNYKQYKMIGKGQSKWSVCVKKGEAKSVSLVTADEIEIPLKEEEIANLKQDVCIPQYLNAPVYSNIEVGNIKFSVAGKVVASTALLTSKDVKKESIFEFFKDIVIIWSKVMRRIPS